MDAIYAPHRHSELNAIALGIVQNIIFTSWQLERDLHTDAGIVFLPIMLMDASIRRRLITDPPGMLYAYYEDAFPRGVNGFPMFHTVGILSRTEAEYVKSKVVELRAALKSALSSTGEGEGDDPPKE